MDGNRHPVLRRLIDRRRSRRAVQSDVSVLITFGASERTPRLRAIHPPRRIASDRAVRGVQTAGVGCDPARYHPPAVRDDLADDIRRR
jgi:hypothetical protein